MKFDQLYNMVFEKDGTEAIPANYNVEPAPIVNPEAAKVEVGEVGAKSLMEYVLILDQTVDHLNGTTGESLQKLLKTLDRPSTPFEGISEELWSEINRAAESLSALTTMLKAYVNKNTAEVSYSAPASLPPEK